MFFSHSLIFFFKNYHLIALICFFPISCILAWQDFNYLQVDKKLSIIGILLILKKFLSFEHAICVIAITFFLCCYQKIRPFSIQKIDIAFFFCGMLWFEINYIPLCCFLISFFMIFFKVVFKLEKIPFLTAWVLSFWILIFAYSSLQNNLFILSS